jgi:hypothetical protein
MYRGWSEYCFRCSGVYRLRNSRSTRMQNSQPWEAESWIALSLSWNGCSPAALGSEVGRRMRSISKFLQTLQSMVRGAMCG